MFLAVGIREVPTGNTRQQQLRTPPGEAKHQSSSDSDSINDCVRSGNSNSNSKTDSSASSNAKNNDIGSGDTDISNRNSICSGTGGRTSANDDPIFGLEVLNCVGFHLDWNQLDSITGWVGSCPALFHNILFNFDILYAQLDLGSNCFT